jgi:hypothetical protein
LATTDETEAATCRRRHHRRRLNDFVGATNVPTKATTHENSATMATVPRETSSTGVNCDLIV